MRTPRGIEIPVGAPMVFKSLLGAPTVLFKDFYDAPRAHLEAWLPCGTWDLGRGTWDVGRGMWDVGRGTWDVGRGPWISVDFG